MSVVFYKFSSQKEFSTISFDGTGISVFDLKRQIIEAEKMGKGTDFDFAIYNPETLEGTFCRPFLGAVRVPLSTRIALRVFWGRRENLQSTRTIKSPSLAPLQ
jgi:hypothetical protein